MNWPFVITGLVATLLASVTSFAVCHMVPNYDDGEYVPPFVVALVLGTAISFTIGYLA